MDAGGSGIFAFLSDPDSFPTIETGEAQAGIVLSRVPPAGLLLFGGVLDHPVEKLPSRR